jgi:hypothetical protein
VFWKKTNKSNFSPVEEARKNDWMATDQEPEDDFAKERGVETRDVAGDWW